jgi:hypothetical protein
VVDGKVAKAYPAAILAQHGVVQDRLEAGPIAVTWCSYCNTALVFRAEAKGQPLEFDSDGVIGSNEVFKDRQTGSRWQQSILEAISGPLKGEHLQLFPFLLTNWHEWHRLHPDTLVLKPLPGYAERIPAVNALIREGLSGKGDARYGVIHRDDRLPPKQMIVGLDIGGTRKAFSLAALREIRVFNDRLGSEPVVIVHQPDSDTTTGFLARAKGRTLTFEATDDRQNEMIDRETNSHWNPYGLCVSGSLRGAQLESLILEPEYWFTWSEFHPDTAMYGTATPRP